jgi:hypothetical protein
MSVGDCTHRCGKECGGCSDVAVSVISNHTGMIVMYRASGSHVANWPLD